jgi:hypothetical protein
MERIPENQTVRDSLWPAKSLMVVALASALVVACASESTAPIDSSPIAGLAEGQSTDSTGAPPPPSPNPAAPGYVRGTVLGPSAPGAGNDSLNTAPRVAGVKVTAYPRVAPTASDTIGIGPAAATVTTGADGKFELPTLPGGGYLVTFVPPEGSIYGGIWVTGPIHSTSHEWPWWIVLWKKP